MADVDAVGNDGSATEWEGPITPERVGLAAGAFDLVAFAAVAYLLFEDPLVSALVGALAGVGGALMIPFFVRASAEEADDDAAGAATADGTDVGTGDVSSVDVGGRDRGVHRGAVGMALSGGAILALASMFVVEDPLIAALVALVAAVGSYVPLSLAVPRL